MNNPSDDFRSGRLIRLMSENSRRMSGLHELFLKQRTQAVREMANLISAPLIQTRESTAIDRNHLPSRQPALFDENQLNAFGKGHLSSCFGEAFKKYDQRQIPRIPNGDLRMMSRVTRIQGEIRNFSVPASVEVEYDVPQDAWYLGEGISELFPFSLLMEVALQPCGFLSAYLDTYALVPYETFYFRNLDGNSQIVSHPGAGADLRGKTLVTQANLVNSVTSGGSVIQRFRFDVRSIENKPGRGVHFQGESTFGYFSASTMANQVGLDSGRKVSAWLQEVSLPQVEMIHLHNYRQGRPPFNQPLLPTGRFGFLDQIQYAPNGGRYKAGYIYSRIPVNPADWFYPFHFDGDPVMPGSLGIECVLEAIKASALAGLPGVNRAKGPMRFALLADKQPMSWRYRGQVTPAHHWVELEVHLHPTVKENNDLLLSGDANIWVDGTRIYQINNIGLRCYSE